MSRKRSRHRQRKAAKTSSSPAIENTRPADLDEFWLRLRRRLAVMQQTWRDCRETRCRRTHRCMDAGVQCIRSQPQVENPNPQERAQALHELRVMLDKAARERRAQ